MEFIILSIILAFLAVNQLRLDRKISHEKNDCREIVHHHNHTNYHNDNRSIFEFENVFLSVDGMLAYQRFSKLGIEYAQYVNENGKHITRVRRIGETNYIQSTGFSMFSLDERALDELRGYLDDMDNRKDLLNKS